MAESNFIEKQQRVRELLTKAAEDGLPIPVKRRVEIAHENGVSVSLVNIFVRQMGFKGNHEWTKAERKDIWLNYEQQGARNLADKYKVSVRAIIQQIQVMKQVHSDEPWDVYN